MISPILLVDDDATYRDRLARALTTRGHQVETAGDAESAIAAARHHQPGGIVLDLKMPGRTGVAVIEELRAAAPGARIIILTGYGSIATAMEAVRLGAADYLTKPADADQILMALGDSAFRQAKVAPQVPTLDRVEWEHIQRVLTECGGNISKAARLLGLHRRSLQRKLEKLPPEH